MPPQAYHLRPDKQNIIVLEENDADDNSIEKITYSYVSPKNAGMNSITGRRHSSHMLLPITWEENCFGRSSDEKPAGKRM